MIIDSAIIEVRSGRGGHGAVSFRRQKYIPKGGPDGGDGGNGGSVVLLADPEVQTLLDFAGRHHWRAEHGEDGRAKQQYGKAGRDLTIKLPVGTVIHDHATGEPIVDLDHAGQRVVIAQGGKGGLGNEHFKSSTNQTPREATPGEPTEEKTLRLELKLIADLGLVGLPNAGKSTLLSRISQATPKVADYPFTTLEPQLGIADLPGHRRIVVADLPGLIENAHDGSGLGDRFLRHVERTRLLLHVLDPTPPDGSDPIDNYNTIRAELEQYQSEDQIGGPGSLADKTQIIALSKMDTVGGAEDRDAAVQRLGSALGQKVHPISAATGQGLDALLEACWSHLQTQRDKDEPIEKTGWGRPG